MFISVRILYYINTCVTLLDYFLYIVHVQYGVDYLCVCVHVKITLPVYGVDLCVDYFVCVWSLFECVCISMKMISRRVGVYEVEYFVFEFEVDYFGVLVIFVLPFAC